MSFTSLNQIIRYYSGMASTPNGDVYACVYQGSIYKRTGGTGDFVGLGTTVRDWYTMSGAPNGDVYACTYPGKIYIRENGSSSFVVLPNQTIENWTGITVAPNGDVYACTFGGDIYKRTGGIGDFVALGQTSRYWYGMASTPNGDVYACENAGDIYKQTDGTGNFIALGQTIRNWAGMSGAPNGDVYTCENIGDIYKRTGGTGNFVELNEIHRAWFGITVAPNGDVYACTFELGTGNIYIQLAPVIIIPQYFKVLNIPTIGFKHESIPYTPENLVASDYHYSINNEIKIMVNIENYLQEINTGNFSKFASISGKRMCAVNFSIDLYTMSDITVAPSYFDILQSCGWKKLLVNEQNTSDFESLGVSQVINWMGITVAPNGDVYACAYNNGNIYKQTGGEGSFISLKQTLRNWYAMTSNAIGDVYCATEEGGIYKQTNGEGDFILVAQIPSCHGICCTPNNDIYACAYSFGIYKQTNSEGDFVCIWSTVKNFRGITSNSNNDIYTAVYSGDIYKLPNGESNFIALDQTHRNWGGITALQISDDVYANEYGGDIYKQTNGTGDFIALGQTTRYWRGMSNNDNGIYACAYNVNGIYKAEITSSSGITIFPDSLYNSIPASIEVSFPEEVIEPRQIVYKISGAMGYVKFTGETGKPIKAEFSFIGAFDKIYTREFENMIVPENFDSAIPIALLGATFQLFGNDVSLQSFEINSGEIIELFSNIMKHHGYDGTRIVDRNTIGILEINSDAEIPADFTDKIIDNQQGDFLLSVGNLSLIASDVKVNEVEDELKKFKIEMPVNLTIFQGVISMISKLYDQLSNLLIEGISNVIHILSGKTITADNDLGLEVTNSLYISVTKDIYASCDCIEIDANDQIYLYAINEIVLAIENNGNLQLTLGGTGSTLIITGLKSGSNQLNAGATENEVYRSTLADANGNYPLCIGI
jgi:hypothetical protein